MQKLLLDRKKIMNIDLAISNMLILMNLEFYNIELNDFCLYCKKDTN